MCVVTRSIFIAGWILLSGCSRPTPEMMRPSPASPSEPAPAPTRTEPAVDPALISTEMLQAVEHIGADELRTAVAELSADELEGRGPGTSGDRKARQRLIERLSGLGYEPAAGDSQWEQPFPIVGITADVPEQWTFRGPRQSLHLKWWNEFIAASGTQKARVEVKDAEVVFAGYGIVAPEQEWDDFAGADVRGKIILLLNSDPDWDPDLFAGKRRLYYGRWTYKYEEAARQGAAGAIIIHTTGSAGYPWQVVQTSWNGEQMELPAGDEPRTPIHAWVTEDAARRLVALGGHDLDELRQHARNRDFHPMPLGVRTSLAFDNTLQRTKTANVAGLRRGSDPDLADEVVVVTAHHDHLGLGKPGPSGDPIYNGARDNASGMAMALGVAQAWAALDPPPRRSVLFLFVGAEEQGLLGSKYYAQHPTFAPPKMVANLNFELGNIWGRTHDVVVVGPGKTSLDEVLKAMAEHQGRKTRAPTDPDAGWYYRSDQLSFARIGVPALWFRSGTDFVGKPAGWGETQEQRWIEEHYHQVSDELRPSWVFDGMVDDARLAFLVAVAVANADQPPTWSPGDEFAAVRARSLKSSAQ